MLVTAESMRAPTCATLAALTHPPGLLVYRGQTNKAKDKPKGTFGPGFGLAVYSECMGRALLLSSNTSPRSPAAVMSLRAVVTCGVCVLL